MKWGTTAAFESIAYQVSDALDAMRAEGGVELATVAADGGPTASSFLMQFTADMTGVVLRVSTVAECSALGAVFAGRFGLGEFADLAGLARTVSHSTAYQPRRNSSEVKQLRAGWQAAVRRTLVT
ncbi:MAG: hypothetical protein J6386_24590 [Candidatus Synoicihabitans palmerolidicus]|nr:hypothetical protein [Candidatus Synoicihabitans palmerolidicus]MCC5025760.1 hypothetical protein [Candidatus Synoicihabitans palmerolidicus]